MTEETKEWELRWPKVSNGYAYLYYIPDNVEVATFYFLAGDKSAKYAAAILSKMNGVYCSSKVLMLTAQIAVLTLQITEAKKEEENILKDLQKR